jgi:hypothetical protein
MQVSSSSWPFRIVRDRLQQVARVGDPDGSPLDSWAPATLRILPMSIEGDQKTTSLFTAGFLIACGPALAYYMAFAYERAFCDKFDVPPELIQPDLTTVLAFTAAVYALSISIFLLVNLFVSLFSLEEKPEHGAIRRLIYARGFLFLFAIVYVNVYRFSRDAWLGAGFVLGCVVLFDVVPALLTWRKHGSFERALEASLQSYGQPGHTAFGILRRRFGEQGVSLLVFCLGAVLLADTMGRVAASRQIRYLVPTSDPNLLIIRIYGNRAIAVPFDAEKKVPKNGIRVLNIGGKAGLNCDWVETGPLNFDIQHKWALAATMTAVATPTPTASAPASLTPTRTPTARPTASPTYSDSRQQKHRQQRDSPAKSAR